MNDLKMKMILEAVDKASPELKKVDGQVDRLDTTVEKVGKSIKVFGGIMAGLALGKLASDFMSVNVEFDRMQASLVTVTGSEAAAKAAFDDIQDFASTTPYQLSQVTDAFIKMKALGLDASMASLRSYGNTASAMGKDLNQMIEAVADASTGEFERLKEFGIKARQNGDTVKFIFRGVTTEVKNSAADIESYLRRIGDVEFSSGMELQMETLGGKLSNLDDEWDKLIRTLGEAGANDTAAWAITNVTEALKGMSEAIDELSDKDSKFQKTVNWLNTGSLQIIAGMGAGNQGSYTPQELSNMDLAGNYISGSKIQIQGVDAFQDRANKRELDLALQQNTFKPTTPGEALTDKEIKEFQRSAKDITDSWQQMYNDRNEVQSRSLDVQIQMEKEAAELSKIPWEATKDFWQMQAEDKFEVLSRSTEALIALDKTWQTSLMDGLDELADYYDETFGDRLTGTVFDAFGSMEDTLVDFVLTGKASFKDMVSSILADIARLVVQQNITSPLASALNAGISGLFNSGSGGVDPAYYNIPGATAVASANGNIFSNGRVVPFANGTIVTKPTYFPMAGGDTGLMGEAGEEGILPLKRINGKLGVIAQGGGGGTTVHQSITVDARGSSVSAADLENAVARGAAEGYSKVYNDIIRRGAIRKAL